MTRFCAIVQWSSSSSVLSHHTVTLSTTVPCHQLKCTWRSCSRLSIWLHWENLLFLALQSLQLPQWNHQRNRTDQITSRHSVITIHHLSDCLKALLYRMPLTISLLQYVYILLPQSKIFLTTCSLYNNQWICTDQTMLLQYISSTVICSNCNYLVHQLCTCVQ